VETAIAEIITIGNEVVIGRTINTNASHIAWRLTSIGFMVKRIIAIRDDEEDIKQTIVDSIRKNPNLIVTSGGLGPTYDDKTLESIGNALNLGLEINQEALAMIKEKYSKKGLPLTEEREKMAYLPHGAMPVRNDEGIAPGVTFEYKGIQFLCTPGVPREMENVLENFILTHLKVKPNVFYYEESFTIKGVGESSLASVIKEIVKKYNLYVKSHPKGRELLDPELEIQIAGSSPSRDKIVDLVKSCRKELEEKIKEKFGVSPQ